MEPALRTLKTQLSGDLLLPEDSLYEQTRRGWNLTINHYPALIVVPHTTQDMVLAVNYAREAGLAVAVQLTGHGIQNPANDSLLIVTKKMTEVQVDPIVQTARIGAGALWQHVLEQATPHGLAPLLGSAPHVGVVGYTLGGGIGWLARKYGLAADHVKWIELVTADGEVRRAGPSENEELFWGILGGSGNFGVVTAMEFKLFPVATIYGGQLTYPGTSAREALRFFRDWTATLPDEMTSSIGMMHFPALPFLPEALHNTTQVMVRAVYTGDAQAGAALIQRWLDWHPPLANTFAELPFAAIGTVSNDPTEPSASLTSNEMVNELSDEIIDIIVTYMTNPNAPLIINDIRHARGAITHGNHAPNAIGHRDAGYYFTMGGVTPTAEAYSATQAYFQHYKNALRPYLHGGVYLNFLKGKEAQERVQDGYHAAEYQRLLMLKATYDPHHMFRHSFPLVEQLGGAPLTAQKMQEMM
jgi:FAD/FMN-containing dehydrogenase